MNAEGEKLQKVVALASATPEQLLATNKSVRDMVESISRLEMILQSKLSLFEDCLCAPCTATATKTATVTQTAVVI